MKYKTLYKCPDCQYTVQGKLDYEVLEEELHAYSDKHRLECPDKFEQDYWWVIYNRTIIAGDRIRFDCNLCGFSFVSDTRASMGEVPHDPAYSEHEKVCQGMNKKRIIPMLGDFSEILLGVFIGATIVASIAYPW